jgi:hypothetical protein
MDYYAAAQNLHCDRLSIFTVCNDSAECGSVIHRLSSYIEQDIADQQVAVLRLSLWPDTHDQQT